MDAQLHPTRPAQPHLPLLLQHPVSGNGHECIAQLSHAIPPAPQLFVLSPMWQLPCGSQQPAHKVAQTDGPASAPASPADASSAVIPVSPSSSCPASAFWPLASTPGAEASGAPDEDPEPVVASGTLPASAPGPTPRSPVVPEHASNTATEAGKKKRAVALGATNRTLTTSR
jgi:hypothetical protein